MRRTKQPQTQNPESGTTVRSAELEDPIGDFVKHDLPNSHHILPVRCFDFVVADSGSGSHAAVAPERARVGVSATVVDMGETLNSDSDSGFHKKNLQQFKKIGIINKI